MIVVDTSVWIEFLRQSDDTIIDLLNAYIENGEAVALSLVFGELLQGAKNEAEEKQIIEFWNSLPKLNENAIMIEAGKLSYKRKLASKGIGLIDSCLLVACKSNKMSLWTLDKKLLEEYRNS
ncbi:MAG TPA: PIN domain-containing protein [Cyclobacteriaceae bacterium]|jgi:predicted nucleic acid-binding protein|nr:PIN domain-containing protein [Cytophagales bacterium]HMR57695.1 PIN domain-containing protein [Cyclobacteriaceae bacterium]HNT49602.1 PIN domain-containing protein [Cyclobacteriaceae bacterium]HRE66551.1 PIN domain-containing protein [Cyclobacteriaceae bacterium]HRF31915.1 PIN domain-containing protein [Cyclobacteriaceae bacterium]